MQICLFLRLSHPARYIILYQNTREKQKLSSIIFLSMFNQFLLSFF